MDLTGWIESVIDRMRLKLHTVPSAIQRQYYTTMGENTRNVRVNAAHRHTVAVETCAASFGEVTPSAVGTRHQLFRGALIAGVTYNTRLAYRDFPLRPLQTNGVMNCCCDENEASTC
jgi:hypothetical protein